MSETPMSARPFVTAFLMDPIESIDIDADTTFVLMLEAQARDHEVLVGDPRDLLVEDGAAVARLRPVTLRRERGSHARLGAERTVVLARDVALLFQRKDPPVDAAYVTALQILMLCRRTLVLNRPQGVLAANEKLYAVHFPDLMPETRVTRSIPELLNFLSKLGGEMIVKPLDGRGGAGIFHVHRDDRNLSAILEQATSFGTRWIMAQRYLPAIREGDKRILLLEGEPIGALLRIPSEHEHRANLHVGGRAARASLDDEDRRIVERLGPSLRRDGLFFVGIDVIGGLLTEVNVTSPTGVQEVNTLENGRLEARVIECAERLARDRARSATRSSDG
jgi:glutathione synthase